MTSAIDPELPDIPAHPRPADYMRLARELAASNVSSLEPLRVAVLSSATLDFLRPVMVVEGARRGYELSPFFGGFGQLEQPILDTTSDLHSFEPDVLALSFQPRDLSPDAVDRYYRSDGGELERICDDLIDRLVKASRSFREHTGRPVFVANFAQPAVAPLGLFDAGDPNGLTHRLSTYNALLAEKVGDEPGIYIWDYAGLVGRSGSASWADARLSLIARAPVSAANQPVLVRHLIRTIGASRRTPAKCLVLDLDNTLWGGVIGDDGLEGLQLGDDWPGNAFKSFQRSVLSLRDRGILLAVASKNDEAVAKRVFEDHPEMLIGLDDIAASRINWHPKSANLRSIAAELNIGEDALVLFDDNPVERAEVRAALPHVGVIEVPVDPVGYREALFASGLFDQLALSSEDRKRAEMYRVERERKALQEEAPGLEAFLESLEMVAEVGVADAETLGRIVQLIGKTNQFNMTTRRHTQNDVARMADAEDSVVGWLRIRDRFGDQGLIAVGILRRRDGDAWIDTFLMSCRVMNRGVERAMMAYLGEKARELGCARLIGEYRPTAKNHIVEQLFSELGFDHLEEAEGATLWELDLTDGGAEWPPHIRRAEATRRVGATL